MGVFRYLPETRSIVIVVLLTIVEIEVGEGVKFYDYPISIPTNSPGGRTSRLLVTGGENKNQKDFDDGQGVQFLVNSDNQGSYHFGYDTGGGNPTSYREERRDPDGRIYGRYGYVDPDGILRITEYVADSEGFRSTESKRLLFDTSELQLIGPIPKPLNDYYKKQGRRTSSSNKFY